MAGIDQPTATEDSLSEFPANIAETARTLFLAPNVDDTLQRVVDLAVATIEGCDFAGVFLRERATITTRAHTDPIVAEVDAIQCRTGEGPCLQAVAEGTTIYADDLADDARWPKFAPEATARGLRSVFALCLSADGTVGALNLYARYPGAFGVVDRAKGLILASLAGLAIASARAHEDEERRAGNFQAALATREVIGQAQGILMERERISADEAFVILRRASQHLNRKLREVAQDLVDTGEKPRTESVPVSPLAPVATTASPASPDDDAGTEAVHRPSLADGG
jgi:putative methionine-R-sulfoxide reductase with GAF domain